MLTKKCEYCAEEINVDAKKCKHCGEYLTDDLRNKQPNINEKKVIVEHKRGGLMTFLIVLAIIALIVMLVGI